MRRVLLYSFSYILKDSWSWSLVCKKKVSSFYKNFCFRRNTIEFGIFKVLSEVYLIIICFDYRNEVPNSKVILPSIKENIERHLLAVSRMTRDYV